jgi:NIMA (never in mitosis gene a)-related kinase
MNAEEKKEAFKEAKIMEVITNHPNIILFKEVYKTKKGELCIVMDYANGGDLS